MPATKSQQLPDLSVRIMLRVLEEAGADTREVLAQAGIPNGLPSIPGEISSSQEIAFQRAFVAATGYRPDLWLKTGLRYHLPSYGGLGMALITSQTLEEMLLTGLGARELDYSLANVTPIRTDELVGGEEVDVTDVPDSLAEFTVYRDIGAVMTALSDVWNGCFPVRRIELALPRPSRAPLDILGHPVVFDAERNAIIWDPAHSRRQLHYADPVLHAAYLELCQIKIRVHDPRDELVTMLEQQLMGEVGIPLSLARLAAVTGQSERTLQRRLLAHGVRFRDLADEARRRVALRLLETTRAPIAEVAWRLGYTETTSFTHAFRRWTGINPGAIRRRMA